MKGISVLSALALIADIAVIDRFSISKNLCSYLRTAPAVEKSNEKTIIKLVNKFSRKLSLKFLVQSILHFRNNNLELYQWYEKKCPFIKKEN